MEAIINYSLEDLSEKEFRDFIMDGWLDARKGNLLDFDEVFDDLEKRFHVNDTSKQFIKGLKYSISSLSFSPYRFSTIQNKYLQ
jgi:hypothetical protein